MRLTPSRRGVLLLVAALDGLVSLTGSHGSLSLCDTAPPASTPHRPLLLASVLPIPPLSLRGGRELPEERAAAAAPGRGDAGETRAPQERPMPDVSEAMKAKIAKHRQMRKPKPAEDARQSQTQRERQKQHAERRDRRDAQRATNRQLKVQGDRKRRPFMRERSEEKRAARAHGRVSAPKAAGAATAENTAPGSGGDSDTRKVKKLGIAMPARESILRPFWDPQAKGRDLASTSAGQRQSARQRLLHALVNVQREHQRNTSEHSVHAEVRYALMRLVRGLASDTAGDAFLEALVVILRSFAPEGHAGLQTERAAEKAENSGAGKAAHNGQLRLLTAADVFALMDRHLDDSAAAAGGVKGEALSAREVSHGRAHTYLCASMRRTALRN
jgi:hypothetical protein